MVITDHDKVWRQTDEKKTDRQEGTQIHRQTDRQRDGDYRPWQGRKLWRKVAASDKRHVKQCSLHHWLRWHLHHSSPADVQSVHKTLCIHNSSMYTQKCALAVQQSNHTVSKNVTSSYNSDTINWFSRQHTLFKWTDTISQFSVLPGSAIALIKQGGEIIASFDSLLSQ